MILIRVCWSRPRSHTPLVAWADALVTWLRDYGEDGLSRAKYPFRARRSNLVWQNSLEPNLGM